MTSYLYKGGINRMKIASIIYLSNIVFIHISASPSGLRI